MVQITAKFNFKPQAGDFCLNVNLDIKATGLTAIFGASGSGKTSLLRCIAGLENAQNATMRLGDEIWQNADSFTPAHKRNIGYIFQDANLFEHLTVAQNLAYAQKRARNKTSIQTDDVVEILNIGHLQPSYPAQLSGGEKQRVAMARAILSQPKLLLMDEPLASLDKRHKQQIFPLLERIKNQFNIPIIYVTHAMDEVARLADQLLILDAGKIVAQGRLSDMLARLDVPILHGEDMGVVIEATIAELNPKWHLARAVFSGGELWIADNGKQLNQNIRIRVLARDVSLSTKPSPNDTSILNSLAAMITKIVDDAHPAHSLVQIKVADQLFLARITNRSLSQLQLEVGSKVWANIKSVSVMYG